MNEALLRGHFEDTDTVLELLRRAMEEREDLILLLRVFPSLRYLHSDPRFIDIVEQIGLDYEPQSWP